MREKILYEYSIIRFVPKVEREEFINIGVIMFSKKHNFLKVKYFLNDNRINAFAHDFDLCFIDSNLKALSEIAQGSNTISEVSKFDIAERFRWLTAVRSSCIQTSRPHPGKTYDLDRKLENLYREYII
ncbi:DUF3037 domain-containing protein [Faecalibacter rhinopitheci]|uniref:DUF3037 domain-containing protein n=1 Tax=Faecalibacter rhinopitheci TaxID=2779678 RepID=A0A8J7G4Q6_9FLAO|nr:DUF3037 domain-containing protein [Faecalibacter rhinopitheci]MBF0596255.1 DUF3037 domain-containing protein [Faecalibacter rhinopitheci]MBQ0148540.1 DUF3037 domain-containing protein [Candidatus Onthonaster equi]